MDFMLCYKIFMKVVLDLLRPSSTHSSPQHKTNINNKRNANFRNRLTTFVGQCLSREQLLHIWVSSILMDQHA